MAENFTYELPSTDEYFNGIITIVRSDDTIFLKDKILELLNHGHCEFYDTGKFSGKRWDALGVEVQINVPAEIYSGNTLWMGEIKKSLLKVCSSIMPPKAGYDVLKVDVVPMLYSQEKDVINEISEIVTKGNYLNISADLVDKGKQMAKAYVILYALENYIRQYIDSKLTEKVGVNYMDVVTVSKKTKTGIATKKTQEQGNKWLPLRGDNDLYYMDFIELSDFITANWDYFKDDIKDQNWIKVKMEEMYNIRCLIAHNSYISDDNFQLLEVTTKQILAQLS